MEKLEVTENKLVTSSPHWVLVLVSLLLEVLLLDSLQDGHGSKHQSISSMIEKTGNMLNPQVKTS